MNKLKEKRTAAGLSQSQLANASGVSVRMIQKYEIDDRSLDKAQAITVYQLAKALETTVEDLLDV